MGVFRQPPQPFLGGRQPLAPEQVAPLLGSTAAVDNPPFGLYARTQVAEYTAFLIAWQPPPPLPFQGRKRTPNSVDSPPFTLQTRTPRHASILNAWQPGPPQPTQANKLNPSITAVQVDQPPFGLYARTQGNEYLAKLASWIAAPLPLPTLSAKIVQPASVATADSPPLASAVNLLTLVAQWQPVPFTQQMHPFVVQGVQVDNPPPTRPNAIVAQWFTTTAPLQPRPFVIQSVDNPPPLAARQMPQWQQPFTPAQQRALLVQPPGVVSADAPPPSSTANLVVIAAQWRSTWTLPQQQEFVVQPGAAVANNPPPLNPANLRAIVGQWQPADQPQQQRDVFTLPGSSVDAPPPRSSSALNVALNAWLVPQITQQQRALLAQAGIVVGQPPPLIRQGLNSILSQWFVASSPLRVLEAQGLIVPGTVITPPNTGMNDPKYANSASRGLWDNSDTNPTWANTSGRGWGNSQ